jgi:hypothetical protein
MGIPRYTQIPFKNPGTYPSNPNPDGYLFGLPPRYVSGYPMPNTGCARRVTPPSTRCYQHLNKDGDDDSDDGGGARFCGKPTQNGGACRIKYTPASGVNGCRYHNDQDDLSDEDSDKETDGETGGSQTESEETEEEDVSVSSFVERGGRDEDDDGPEGDFEDENPYVAPDKEEPDVEEPDEDEPDENEPADDDNGAEIAEDDIDI